MKEIGEQLRAAREARGISLKEVKEATKIAPRYLEALEAGNFDVLPGDPYNKAFIRSYARAIDWDATALLDRYDRNFMVQAMATHEPPAEEPVGRRVMMRLNQTLQWLGL